MSHSRWAAPLVPVPKKDGQLRLCDNFKVTINPVMQVDQYPLPKSEDLFTTLVGGQKFTKLDLKQAYQQMQLEEDAKDLVTINMHTSGALPVHQVAVPSSFRSCCVPACDGHYPARNS